MKYEFEVYSQSVTPATYLILGPSCTNNFRRTADYLITSSAVSAKYLKGLQIFKNKWKHFACCYTLITLPRYHEPTPLKPECNNYINTASPFLDLAIFRLSEATFLNVGYIHDEFIEANYLRQLRDFNRGTIAMLCLDERREMKETWLPDSIRSVSSHINVRYLRSERKRRSQCNSAST